MVRRCRGGASGTLLSYMLEAQGLGSREVLGMRGKLQCGVSRPLTWPSCGRGLVPHDLSGIWISQVKPAVSLPPAGNVPHIPGREVR